MKQKLPSRGTILKLIERSLDEGRDKEVVERLQWFLHYSTHGSVSKTCKEFGIARSTFYRWLNRFDINDFSALIDRPTYFRNPKTENRKPLFGSRLAFLIALLIINIGILAFALPTLASAASSWNPTLLVNTEAFQQIDDDDTASDVYLEFGDTLQERLMFKRNESVFATSQGLRVGGVLTATGAIASSGSITAEGALSGASLHVNSLTTLSGAVSIEGNVTTSGTLTVDGTSNLQGVATFGTTVTITEGALADDTIVEGDLKAVDAAADEDIFTFESTTGDFEWHSASDLGIGTATAITDGLIVEPDLDADVAAADGDWLQYDSTGTNFTWRSSSELLTDVG
ncbi:MAG: helix-turn-helix domain-containing protein, partial [Candidatus Peribacteraceae bacterium]|nr:helix-turn-helix domain-containing protein [Candidatus Peribacteraceae bacterium]